MLCLNRREGETIIIGDNIEVQVLWIRGNIVKLGITAPESISIHREEIYHLIQVERATRIQNFLND